MTSHTFTINQGPSEHDHIHFDWGADDRVSLCHFTGMYPPLKDNVIGLKWVMLGYSTGIFVLGTNTHTTTEDVCPSNTNISVLSADFDITDTCTRKQCREFGGLHTSLWLGG